MYFIGIGHRREVGKDLLGLFLQEELERLGLRVERTSFAAQLYNVCHYLYGWAGFQLKEYYDRNKEEKELTLPIGKSPRQLLIEVGCKLREVSPLTWVYGAFKHKKTTDVLILTDVRFHNEVLAFMAQDHILVKVTRESAPKYDDEADSVLKDFEGWTHSIENNGTLEDLRKGAVNLVGTIYSDILSDEMPPLQGG